MSPTGHPKIGRTREEREQDAIAAEVERKEHALDEAALSKPPVPMTDSQRQKAEKEKADLQVALAGTRPSRADVEVSAPVSLNPRVKSTTPEPAVPVVTDADLTVAVQRHAEAKSALDAATVGFEGAERDLKQVRADHAAYQVHQQITQARAILLPLAERATRSKAIFYELHQQYGGRTGTGAPSKAPLAVYARTLPQGDAQRRGNLGELYAQAVPLMAEIAAGFVSAASAVKLIEKALEGGSGDFLAFNVEQAQHACDAAFTHDADATRAACEQLVAAVKAVDGVPGPEEVVVYLDGPSRDAVKNQQFALGMNKDPLA